MNLEDEKGFLSGKFDDWSGEPIPNGWNAIENKLRLARWKRDASVSILILLFIGSVFSLVKEVNSDFQPNNESAGIHSKSSITIASGPQNNLANQNQADFNSPVPTSAISESSEENGRKAGRSTKAASGISEINTYRNNLSNILKSEPVLAQASGQGVAESDAQLAEGQEGHISPESKAMSGEMALPIMLKTPPFLFSNTEDVSALLAAVHSERAIQRGRPGFSKSITAQAAFAVSEVQINHAQTEGWKYGISNARFTTAGYVSAGVRLEQNFSRNFSVFYGLEGGAWMRRMELKSISKTPGSYQLVQTGESEFSVLPEISTQNETRNSLLVFAKSEAGIRKAITRNFGLLASAQLWAGIAHRSWSDLRSAAAFHSPSSSIAPGYRAGVWMQTSPFSQAELSFVSMPENLTASTAGIRFRTRTINLGIRQYF